MSRLVRLVKGIAALVVLVGLVVGVPWALWHFVGWPLPHHVPSASQVGRALDRQGLPAQTLVDALAVVVWLTWATLVTSLAVEIPAALSGRHAHRLPVAGAFQPIIGRLVATVVVACLALTPRPAQTGAASGLAGGAGSLARQPVAALVVHDARLMAGTTPIRLTAAPAGPVSNGSAAPTKIVPVAATSTPVVYTVQRGDTLWGIAQRELGDPLRWSEIYQLNEGRPQPGGAILTDPHWIDPGWTLVLPASTPPASATAAPSGPTPTAPPPATASPPTTPTPAAPTVTVPTPTTATPTTTTTPITGHSVTAPSRAVSTDRPVRLPSGSEVAASFAAGVLSAVALGRLRRRHAYRYRPPEPGRNLGPDRLRPTLRHLMAAAAATNGHQPASPDDVPTMADDDPEHRERPDLIEAASRDGQPVELALSDLGGVTITGPTGQQVVAGWVTALMTRAGPRAAEIVMTRAAYQEVFGPGAPDAAPGLRVPDDPEQVLGVLERLVLSRTRQLAEDDTPDVVAYRQANPWEPVPMVLAVIDRVPGADAGRWAAVATRGSRLGFAVVTCDPDAPLPARLMVGEDRKATAAMPDELAARLVGVELFGLIPSEATDVLATLADAEERPDSTDDNPDADGAGSVGDPEAAVWPMTIPTPHARGDERVPGEPATSAEPEGDEPAAPERTAVVVTVFGSYEIAVDGEVISRGLRTVAKELLAWLCLRPEGASVEAAVDALWPDTERDQVHKAFWQAAANLRTRLGATSDAESKVLVASGDVYRLDPTAVACDLWAFQQVLTVAARAEDDRVARDALRRAVDVYRGDLLVGTDYAWVEPIRQDLHRRALDAHLRLAELDTRLGAPDAAEDTLRRAVDLDRYAEEPYRRLMAVQAERGRPDAVAGTWKLLQNRLAEIDVDPEPATERLHRSLTSPQDTSADRARRARQRS